LSRKLITGLKILLFTAVAVFFLFLAFREVHLSDLVHELKNADYSWVLLSLFFAALAFVSRAMRWIILIEPLGYKPSLKNTFYALMSGYLANFLLPRIGELTRCGSLNRTDGVPVDALLGTVIIDRFFDVIILIILLAVVFVVKIDFFGEFITDRLFIPFLDRLSFSALIWVPAVFFILIIAVLFFFIRKKLLKNRMFSFIDSTARGILSGMRTLFRMRKKWQFIGHTLFIWLMYFLMTWVVFFSLPFTSHLRPVDALFLLVIGGMGMSAPVQAGIGAYHWIVSLGLTLYNIPRQEGVVFATITHESQALLMILLGTFSVIMIFIQQKRSGKEVLSGRSDTESSFIIGKET